MEEGRAHEEAALAPAPRGRRLARPVFLAAVALALFSFAAIVSGASLSSPTSHAGNGYVEEMTSWRLWPGQKPSVG